MAATASPALTDDSGVQRIARELSLVEKAVKAQLEGKDETAETQKRMTLREGFQVARADMFSHTFEPVVRMSRSGITFNSTCVSRLDRMEGHDGQLEVRRVQHVELLFNPVERMLAVRPCAPDDGNAIRWAGRKRQGKDDFPRALSAASSSASSVGRRATVTASLLRAQQGR